VRKAGVRAEAGHQNVVDSLIRGCGSFGGLVPDVVWEEQHCGENNSQAAKLEKSTHAAPS
jgi:hypothetical protein